LVPPSRKSSTPFIIHDAFVSPVELVLSVLLVVVVVVVVLLLLLLLLLS
jgi:hypothetical protein